MQVFDENGQTIQENDPQHADHSGENSDEILETPVSDPEEPGDGVPGSTSGAPTGKYQIGDRFFNTLEEAHNFATSQLSTLEAEKQVSDAYRQGILDAQSRGENVQNVTPQAPEEDDFDEESYYANPKDFLKNYGEKIKHQTAAEIRKELSTQQQSDQIWREFTERHPALADFRSDVEQFVAQNLDPVRTVIATKGQAASYDYIAMKLRERFSRYAQAVRPEKKLPNTSAGASPSGQPRSVTPQKVLKKPLSFADQLRSIKKKR